MADGQAKPSPIQTRCSFIWSIAEILLGYFKEPEYAKAIPPFVARRHLNCIFAPTKETVFNTAVGLPSDIDEATRARSRSARLAMSMSTNSRVSRPNREKDHEAHR